MELRGLPIASFRVNRPIFAARAEYFASRQHLMCEASFSCDCSCSLRRRWRESHFRFLVLRRKKITGTWGSRPLCSRSCCTAFSRRHNANEEIGGGGGSRTRVRKCYWSRELHA